MKKVLYIVLLFALTAAVALPAQYVRFEGGRELEIESYAEEGEWITFNLKGGGSIGVKKENVTKIGESEEDRVFIVSGRQVVSGKGDSGATGPAQSAPRGTESPERSTGTGGPVPGVIDGPGPDKKPVPPEGGGTEEPKNGEEPGKKGDRKKPGENAGGAAEFSLSPSSVTVEPGQNFSVILLADRAENIGHVSVYVYYDQELLEAVDVQDGGFLSIDGADSFFLKKIKGEQGIIIIGISRKGDAPGASGSGTLLSMVFNAKKPGETHVRLGDVKIKTPALNIIPSDFNACEVTITE